MAATAMQVRLPADLYDLVRENAAREYRSLNKEILLRLRRSFEREQSSASSSKPVE